MEDELQDSMFQSLADQRQETPALVTSSYLELVTRLANSTEFSQIFERHAALGKDDWSLSDLLLDLSVECGVDFSQAVEYFDDSINEDDPEDIMFATDLNEASFRRRLSNFCLAKANALDSTSTQTTRQYIAAYWADEQLKTPTDVADDLAAEREDAAQQAVSMEVFEEAAVAEMIGEAEQVNFIEDVQAQALVKTEDKPELLGDAQAQALLRTEDNKPELLEDVRAQALLGEAEHANCFEDVQTKALVKAENRPELPEDEQAQVLIGGAAEQLNFIEDVQAQMLMKTEDKPELSEEVQFRGPEDRLDLLDDVQIQALVKTESQSSLEFPSKAPSDKMKPMTYAISDGPLAEGIMERNSRILTKEEIFDMTDDLDLERVQKPTRPETWLTPSLQSNAEQIQDSFSSQVTSSMYEVSQENCRKVFAQVLTICGVTETMTGTKLFSSLLQQQGLSFVSHQGFIDLMENWAAKYTPESNDLASKIRQTISEYEGMMKLIGEDDPACADLQTLIVTLKEQLQAALSRGSRKTRPRAAPLTSKGLLMKGLKEIFAFYARQQKIIGAQATFDNITHNNSVWTLGKFFKFCKDFELMGKTTRDQRRLGRDELAVIFKKFAELAKILKEDSLVGVLGKIAEVFFNAQYDQVSAKPPVADSQEKLDLMMMYLGCDRPEVYQQKMKGFGHAFSKERTGYRIPESDLSKKYAYRPPVPRPRHQSQKSESHLSQEPAPDTLSKLRIALSRPDIPMPTPPKSVRLGQEKSSLVRSDLVKSDQFNSDLVKSDQVKTGRVHLKHLTNEQSTKEEEEDMLRALGIDEAEFNEEEVAASPLIKSQTPVKARQLEDTKVEQMLRMHDRRMQPGLKAIERVQRSIKGFSRK
jgi:hypothetical protein